MENKTPLFIGIAAIGLIGIAAFMLNQPDKPAGSSQRGAGSAQEAATEPALPNDSKTSPAASSGTALENGQKTQPGQGAMAEENSYRAVGTYKSPAGPESIEVALALSNGAVSSVAITPKADNAISLRWQKAFADGISAEVVGKRLDEINVVKVSGSSLTPIGFMNALQAIKTQIGG